MLDVKSPRPLSSRRKEHFEKVRKNNVPRFLFRAFSPESGGGPSHTLNNPNLVVPHAYMEFNTVPNFYATPERLLRQAANAHYLGKQDPISPFSSWAASLHLVLCFASSLGQNAHVAVMDTEKLDGEVLVWHVPHLMSGTNHEYLAHGIIKGDGFIAVPLLSMEENGLLDVFSELKERERYIGKPFSFGFKLRKSMFECKHKPPKADVLRKVSGISKLFGELWFPVATALLCVRPWPWFQRGVDKGRSAPATKELERILRLLGVAVKPAWLESQLPWLQDGAVQTTPGTDGMYDFPDVRQWIDLLHAISCHAESEKSNKRKREKVVVASGDEDGSRSKRKATESNKVGVC